MHYPRFAAAATAALALAAAAASAAPISSYSQIYAFGDSLSDVGNIYAQSGNSVPVSPPYANGRFSNGNVWLEDIADQTSLGPIEPSLEGGNDYAYGGAQTGTTLAHDGVAIDLDAQLDQFQANVPNPADDALYTLWIGANDVNAFISGFQSGALTLADASTFIAQATSNVGDVVTGLADGGLQNLAALDVPDLSKTPTAIAAANQTDEPQAALAQVSALTNAFDTALDEELRRVAQENGIDLTLGNTFERINNIVANPGEFGLTNVTDPCWTGGFISADSGSVCDNPDEHLFWDGLHPTRRGHQIVADVALEKLRADNGNGGTDGTTEPVPAPGGAVLFVVALAGVAAATGYRRRAPAIAG